LTASLGRIGNSDEFTSHDSTGDLQHIGSSCVPCLVLLPPREEHTPRRLHEKAKTRSCPHAPQWTRWAEAKQWYSDAQSCRTCRREASYPAVPPTRSRASLPKLPSASPL